MAGRTKSRMPPMFTGMPVWLRGGHGELHPVDHAAERTTPATRFSAQLWILLAVNGLFVSGNALSAAFVSVYLWKASGNFVLIGTFAAIQQLTMAVTFWLGGIWVKERNKMNALRLGVLTAALFYGLVLLLGPMAIDYVWVLGIVQGIGTGLFWLAFNVIYFEVTDPGNRDRFNGLAGLLSSGAGMLAPWISGYVITRMPDTTGYQLIFSLSLLVFVLGAATSFFLKKRESEGHYEWLFVRRKLKNSEGVWKRLFFTMTAQGIREGVFGFLIALLVYISTGNEMQLGNFSLITSAVALVSFYIVGRLLKPTRRRRGILLGVTGMIAVIVPFFWTVNFTTLLVFGIGTALFIPLYTVPVTSTAFDLIGKDKEGVGRREEFIVLRELGLNTGRLLGITAFIIVAALSPTTLSINILMLVIGSAPLLVWILIRSLLPDQSDKAVQPDRA